MVPSFIDVIDANVERSRYQSAASFSMFAASLVAARQFAEADALFVPELLLAAAAFLWAATTYGWATAFALAIKSRLLMSQVDLGDYYSSAKPYEYAHPIFRIFSNVLIFLTFVVDPLRRSFVWDNAEIYTDILKIGNRGFLFLTFGGALWLQYFVPIVFTEAFDLFPSVQLGDAK